MDLYKLYQEAKTERQKNIPLWTVIAKYSGITLNLRNIQNDLGTVTANQGFSEQQDQYIDDPTAAISVNQAGDYLQGIIWGNGQNVFQLEPSDEVLELTEHTLIADYYKYATSRVQHHFNHPEAGLAGSIKPYIYDQVSIGTSGIGCFLNKSYFDGNAENALVFRSYGVDNMAILEGINGMVDYCFVQYNWRANRIIGEFCFKDGQLDKQMFARMPEKIKAAYDKNDYTTVFPLIYGFYPREDYNPRLKGKRGYKFKTCWFLDDSKENKPFLEGDSKERPIPVGRMIRIRDEIYGRSQGTLLISSIRMVNFLMTSAIENVEKLNRPAMGIFSDAVFGDSAIDTSAGELVPLNANFAGGKDPLFPLYDVGDPSGIYKVLLPYLQEKITTGFKIDTLLDFSSAKEMTATESMQRFVIRGKSLSGMLLQQKLTQEQVIRQGVSLLFDNNLLGVDPIVYEEEAAALKKRGRGDRIIPAEVMEVIKAGRPWYKIKYNNELEKLTRTETIENLNQLLQGSMAIMNVAPETKVGMKWYEILKDYAENSDKGDKMVDKKTYDAMLEGMRQQAQMAQMAQIGEVASKATKNTAQAEQAKRG